MMVPVVPAIPVVEAEIAIGRVVVLIDMDGRLIDWTGRAARQEETGAEKERRRHERGLAAIAAACIPLISHTCAKVESMRGAGASIAWASLCCELDRQVRDPPLNSRFISASLRGTPVEEGHRELRVDFLDRGGCATGWVASHCW
jgi:hypothetical protein